MFSSSSGARTAAGGSLITGRFMGRVSRMRRDRAPGPLCVSARLTRIVRPCARDLRRVPSVTPPLASSSAGRRRAQRLPQTLDRHVVEQDPRRARFERLVHVIKPSCTHLHGQLRRRRPRPPHRLPDPGHASSAWFSLIRIASNRPTRWFVPPPVRRRPFSSSLRPEWSCGYRESAARATDRVHAAGRQRATPERRCMKLRAVRSPVSSSARAEPSSLMTGRSRARPPQPPAARRRQPDRASRTRARRPRARRRRPAPSG